MLLFDIGANRGDATVAGLKKGYTVIALEPAPKIFSELVKSFIYNPKVIPLKFAVSSADNEMVNLYEADEDGLSSINEDWLTKEGMPYSGKNHRVVKARTVTIDSLVDLYGKPDLMKIDVEGAEWSVFKGMTKKYGALTFEWTDVTLKEHQEQIEYLKSLGYTKVGPQFIETHLEEPTEYYDIDTFNFQDWLTTNAPLWEEGGWKIANLRPTADVGMCWIK